MVFVYIVLAIISLSGRTLSQTAIESIDGFSVDLLKDTVENGYGNIIMSPLSVSTLLGMVEVGARGNSKEELRQALHYPSQNPKFGVDAYKGILQGLTYRKGNSRSILEFATQLYMSYQEYLYSNYQNVISNNYLAEIRKINFQDVNLSVNTINEMVKAATKGKITSIIDSGAITPDTRLILANEIYFHGIWERQFDKNRTTIESFVTDPTVSGRAIQTVNPNQVIQVSMMQQAGSFISGLDSELRAKWVHLPFDNKEFSMVLVLPTDDNGINELAKRLTKEHLNRIIRTRSTHSVVLRVPRFKISNQLSLVNSLKRLGVQDIFGPAADLRDMSKNKVFVNNILHKAEMEVNEEGSTAAAASAVLVNTLSLSTSEDLIFYANQPFLVFLIQNNPGIPLFVGRVTNPQ
ncbi:hypothetical protein J437_LFUL004213 [Ladona fulva]|uniref:Serpin domain-containing protein n=1 Tax=Ladona fulva TaxID=123851 RepID=A0A8K0JXN1_LADFU|nr:hypothetical protein J437_LFUL004213 [Ladona fulva]